MPDKIVLGGAFLRKYYTAFQLPVETERTGFLGGGKIGIAPVGDCSHPGPAPVPA